MLKQRAEALLQKVKFANYQFHVTEGHGGMYLVCIYMDYKWEEQHTRKWLLSPHMTDSEIIQTAFKCCLTSMEHRTREAFTYKGARIFGPHFDVEDLVRLCKDGKEDAGGREQQQKRISEVPSP